MDIALGIFHGEIGTYVVLFKMAFNYVFVPGEDNNLDYKCHIFISR